MKFTKGAYCRALIRFSHGLDDGSFDENDKSEMSYSVHSRVVGVEGQAHVATRLKIRRMVEGKQRNGSTEET